MLFNTWHFDLTKIMLRQTSQVKPSVAYSLYLVQNMSHLFSKNQSGYHNVLFPAHGASVTYAFFELPLVHCDVYVSFYWLLQLTALFWLSVIWLLVIINYFVWCFKKLDAEQMELLIKSQGASNPLWLSLSCEELRVFGVFETITRHIVNLPSTLKELLKFIMNRLTAEDEDDNIQKVSHSSWLEFSGRSVV